ncbi:MAG: hypothetical protein NVSMB5_14940 [Candidatus Velthaea sp.]
MSTSFGPYSGTSISRRTNPACGNIFRNARIEAGKAEDRVAAPLLEITVQPFSTKAEIR